MYTVTLSHRQTDRPKDRQTERQIDWFKILQGHNDVNQQSYSMFSVHVGVWLLMLIILCRPLSCGDLWSFIYSTVVVICPIAIAYSMGQIIKSVLRMSVSMSVCQSVSVCVRLWALSRSHFLIDFHQNWHRRKAPQRKTSSSGGQYCTTPSHILPPSPPFRPRGPENPYKY